MYTITCCEKFEHNQVRIQGSNLDSSTSNEYLCVMREFFIPAQCSTTDGVICVQESPSESCRSCSKTLKTQQPLLSSVSSTIELNASPRLGSDRQLDHPMCKIEISLQQTRS